MGTVAVKNIPQSSYVDPIQSSIQNDRFVVSRKKITKRVDRSQPQMKDQKERKSPKMPPQQKDKGFSKRKTDKKTKRKYRPGTLALREIR